MGATKKFCVFLTLVLLSVGYSGWAQIKTVGQPPLHNFSKRDYKGGTQSWSIAQSESGSIYLANNAGLLEFDGNFWNTYPLPYRNSIRALKISGDTIYIGGYNGFGYFSPSKSGVLKYHSLSDLLPKAERAQIDNIWKVHLFQNRVIFQSFDRNYIYRNGKLTTLEATGKFQFSFEVGKRLLIQDITSGLYEFGFDGLKLLPNTSFFNGSEIWSILPFDQDKLLLSTLDKGVFIYDGKQVLPFQSQANEFLKKNSCLGAHFTGKDHIVFNSVLDGVIIADRSGNIVQHINQDNGLQNNTVLSSFSDHENNLWLGLDNGISLASENSPLTFFGSHFNLSTVYASVVHKGILYVATNQGLFYHQWPKTSVSSPFSLVNGTTGQAWNIEVIEGHLLCSHNRGLMEIKGNTATNIVDATGYWGIKPLQDHPGKYIGANYNGFSILSISANSVKKETALQGISKSINTFDVEGSIVWMKKDNVLYQCALSHDLQRFRYIKPIEHLRPNDSGIRSIQKINGRLTFQSDKHFFVFDPGAQAFREDKNLNKLFSPFPDIRSVQQDRYGNIWFSYQESLGMMRKESDGYKTLVSPFASLTGLLVNDYISVNANGPNDILIGQTDGLAHFDPKMFSRKQPPVAVIRSVTFSSDSLSARQLKKNEGLDLPFKSNNLRFSFSSPQFSNIDNIEFSYRLKGFEEDWSRWGNATTKEYTNLHEGDYVMELRTRDSYGTVSAVVDFDFTISPPWYRHWFAYLFYLLLVGLGVYYGRKRIQAHIRRNKYFETVEQRRIYLEKEAKIRQDQLELEKQIEQLKNEKLRMKIISKDKELVNNSLQVVKKNKILNGIIHKMKEIDNDRLDETSRFQINKVNKSILKEVNADKSWKDLEKHIRNVHFEFLKRLKEKHPTITPRELDLSTYLLMNMSTKEIAEIMNISAGGVELARYRLRKKLGLAKSENLTGFLMAI